MRSDKAVNWGGVISSTEIIQSRFGVTFFGGELVVVADRQIGYYTLAAEGVVIRLFLNIPCGVRPHIRRAQVVGKIIVNRGRIRRPADTGAGRFFPPRNAFATKKDIIMQEVAIQIGLLQHFAARSIPVECTRATRVQFLYPLSVGVVIISSSDASNRRLGQSVLTIVNVGIAIWSRGAAGLVRINNVSTRVITPTIHLVLDGYGLIQRRIATYGSLMQQVPPDVIGVALAPVSGSC